MWLWMYSKLLYCIHVYTWQPGKQHGTGVSLKSRDVQSFYLVSERGNSFIKKLYNREQRTASQTAQLNLLFNTAFQLLREKAQEAPVLRGSGHDCFNSREAGWKQQLPSFSFPTVRTRAGNSSKPLARLHLCIRGLLALLQMHLCELVRTNSTYCRISDPSNCHRYRSYSSLLDFHSILSLLLT